MIWALVTVGIVGYLAIGLVVSGLMMNYSRHLDDFEAACIVALWPILAIARLAAVISMILGGRR